MTELQTPDQPPKTIVGETAASQGRRRTSAVALVAGGLIAGGVLAGTMSAGATTTEPEPDATTESREFAPRGPGHRTPLDSATAARIEAAITDAYPGGTVIRMGALPGGTYVAHIVDADDAHLAVTLDANLDVVDEKAPPAPLDAATAAAIEQAVLGAYPGATVIRMGALPEGGYAVHLVSAADEHVAVKIADDFTVTGELTGDEIRASLSDRLGRLGDRLERGWARLGDLGDRIERFRERLNADPAPTDAPTTPTTAYTA